MFLKETKYTGHPTYICDKCGKKITDYRPMRIAVQEYGAKSHNLQYDSIKLMDFCDKCWSVLDKWLNTKATKK